MRREALLVMVMATVVVSTTSTSAYAQDPGGCLGNRMGLDIFKDRTYIRDGETVNYYASVRNDAGSGCNVSSASVKLQLPTPGGDPSATLVGMTNLANFSFGFPLTQ